MELYIGNRKYSSWSLRVWLYLRHHEIPFKEVKLSLDTPGFASGVAGVAPTSRVPALVVKAEGAPRGDLHLWETTSILEYLAERFPATNGWPADADARAVARCVSAEMHANFPALRAHLPFNASRSPRPRATWPGGKLDSDVARLIALFEDCRTRFGVPSGAGPYLFGAFCAADCMLAPAALRLHQYAVPLQHAPLASAYVAAVVAHPAVRDWVAAGAAEAEIIASEEVD